MGSYKKIQKRIAVARIVFSGKKTVLQTLRKNIKKVAKCNVWMWHFRDVYDKKRRTKIESFGDVSLEKQNKRKRSKIAQKKESGENEKFWTTS